MYILALHKVDTAVEQVAGCSGAVQLLLDLLKRIPDEPPCFKGNHATAFTSFIGKMVSMKFLSDEQMTQMVDPLLQSASLRLSLDESFSSFSSWLALQGIRLLHLLVLLHLSSVQLVPLGFGRLILASAGLRPLLHIHHALQQLLVSYLCKIYSPSQILPCHSSNSFYFKICALISSENFVLPGQTSFKPSDIPGSSRYAPILLLGRRRLY